MGTNIIKLTGRIDTGNASEWEQRIMPQLSAENENAFEASELEYISSAGLRVLMRARKTVSAEMRIFNASSDVFEILEMTGFTEIFKVEKRLRELSVDGCEVIGKGFYGTVYRIDPETIVKVYHSPDSVPMIKNEQRLAKRAFVKGVPTAISYDIVKVGDKYGSVFELLRASSFNDHLINEPENFDALMHKYVDFLKVVHSAEMDADTIPKAKDSFIGYLEVIREYITQEQHDRLKELLSAMPDDLHMVHGDFQMKNVLLVEGEPMLIDMETIATGQPIFDLQALYVTYIAFSEDCPDNLSSFLGIRDDLGKPIWNSILENYFDTADKSALSVINDKIQLLATIRFLYLLAITDMKNGELGEKRIRRSQEHIAELLPKVADFMI
ncbi:TIGR02172 family protein [Ruminococcus sp. YRD2003]|uniref:STAS domain-containing protein n=1 Tax=Ruminococcus sp. YRD2003 TaxID=1452313 RepID=UPI0008AEE0E1|nr:TIGR02172 family protein [Ruminococcus flavefaciens]